MISLYFVYLYSIFSSRYVQDALRKRKEEEERIAQEVEFLNRSLRGSKKLQALEKSHVTTPSSPSGIDNSAYADDETLSARGPADVEQIFQEEIHKIISEFRRLPQVRATRSSALTTSLENFENMSPEEPFRCDVE